jgi:hypothetical protein
MDEGLQFLGGIKFYNQQLDIIKKDGVAVGIAGT